MMKVTDYLEEKREFSDENDGPGLSNQFCFQIETTKAEIPFGFK
jgi:hypothetical protein